MSSNSNSDSDAANRPAEPHRSPPGTYTYDAREPARQFSFNHDKAAGLFVITKLDGTVERFRDNPARCLVVEPHRETGELEPAVNKGQPVYLYFCRQDRES
jgi:hypothetical protein